MTGSNQETLAWISVADALPDDDTTVLVNAPDSDEPVWLGFYDGCFWFAMGGEDYEEGDVTHWAPMPHGIPR